MPRFNILFILICSLYLGSSIVGRPKPPATFSNSSSDNSFVMFCLIPLIIVLLSCKNSNACKADFGVYEPWEGEILYDGKKITEIPRESFSGSLSVVEIARAIVTKPKVLLFDEATSALDNITQKHVSDSLKNLKSTRIVIAHRLSTIKECDRIIVLDKGHIIEDGTYQSLSKAGGFFSELVERQKN